MARKSIIILSAYTLLQSISAQCIDVININPNGYETSWVTAPSAWDAPYTALAVEWAYPPAATLVASNSPGLAITSASPVTPAGVSVMSENVYDGVLTVGGAVPFLGTVVFEGGVPSVGAGAVSYGCGNGAVGIIADDMGYGFNGMPVGYGAGVPYGSGIGYGPCGYSIFL